MTTLPLGYDPFRLITRLCRPVDVRSLQRGFDFRALLPGLLRLKAPTTAALAEGMKPGEIDALWAEVAEFLELVG